MYFTFASTPGQTTGHDLSSCSMAQLIVMCNYLACRLKSLSSGDDGTLDAGQLRLIIGPSSARRRLLVSPSWVDSWNLLFSKIIESDSKIDASRAIRRKFVTHCRVGKTHIAMIDIVRSMFLSKMDLPGSPQSAHLSLPDNLFRLAKYSAITN